MGKGTRNRQERAEDKVLNPQNYVKKKTTKKGSGKLPTVIFFAVVIVIALALTVNAISNAGVFMRTRTAAASDDFKVNGAVMTYYVHSAYQTLLNNYYESYSSLLSSSSTNYTVYDLLGIDPNASLKDQVRNPDTGETWFDFFASTAISQVEEMLVYCQAAKTAGVVLEDDDYAQIDTSIEMIKLYASLYGMSVNSYLASNYGEGVRMKDVRKALEMTQLAEKYAAIVNEDLYDASTADKVNTYYENNTLDFLSVDYLSYELVAEKGKGEDADTQYAADKAEIDAIAGELMATTTPEAFKEFLNNHIVTSLKDTYMDQHYNTYLAEAEGETDEEKAAAAEQKVMEKLQEEADSRLADILTEDARYTEDDALSTWAFGGDDAAAAALNATYKIAAETEKGDKYTVTVYMLTREAARDEDLTRNFTYVLLSSENYTQDDANEMLTKFEAGEKTAEALLALGDEYEKKTIASSMENVAKGDSGADEVDEWMFGEDIKAGDYQLVTYTYNDVEYYILAYIDGIGDAEWYVDARDAQVADEMGTWYEEQTKTYVVAVNEAVVNKVKM